MIAIAAGASFAGGSPQALAAATPTVVVNKSDRPVPTSDVDNPARQPLQLTLSPSGTNPAVDNFVVPAGKRLVIEYYTAQNTQYPSGGYAYAYLITQAAGNTAYYKVIPPVASTVPLNQICRIYADAGTNVTAESISSSGTTSGASIIISGYYVNVP